MKTKTDNILYQFEIFSSITPQVLDSLIAEAAKKSFASQEVIVQQGSNLPGLIVVLSGQIKSSKTNSAGKEQVFEMFDAGDIYGFSGITGEEAAPTDLIGRQKGEVLIISFNTLRKVIEKDGQFALAIIDHLNRFAQTMQSMVDAYSLKDAHARLAGWLVGWVEKNYPGKSEHFQAVLPFTQSEIAAQVGTVREVISRGFTRMERDGLMAVSGKKVQIISLEGLRKVAEG